MWPFKPKQVKIEVIRRSETKLRLSEWQMDGQLVNTASKVLANPDLQLMLSVLRNEHPSHIVQAPTAPLEARAIQQAWAEGYSMCLRNLENMSISTRLAEPPEAVFENE